MNTVILDNGTEIQCCIQCPFHTTEKDPDPDDWFNSDDVAVRCTKSGASGPRHGCNEPWIAVSCRPQNTERETNIPEWCPLIASPVKTT